MGKIAFAKMADLVFLISLMLAGYGRLGAMQWQGGMDCGIAFPLGQFGKNIDKNVAFPHIALSVAVKLGKLPFYFGLKGNYLSYGHDSRDEAISIPEFGKILFTVRHSYEIYSGFFFIRWQMQNLRPFKPYAGLLIGVDQFYSASSIPAYYHSDGTDTEFASRTNLKKAVFSYGCNAGLMWRLARRKYENRKCACEYLLDFGIQYTFGQRVEYLKEGAIVIVNGEAQYNSCFSTAPILVAHVGLALNF